MSNPKLHIAESFSLPFDAVTQTFAVLAKRGVGKTYTASVMAEEMLAHKQQVVVIDPTGAWYGLRSSADGRGPGFPILVAGGERGDVPLDENAGELLAQAIVERRFSAVIDLSLFRKGQVRRFLTPFLETLYRLNREAMHLFVDEADDICPQKPFGDEAQMVGAMEDVVKRGRRKGIGCTLITQRPADLAKQVLTQCEVLVSMRLTHPRDINAIKEWVNVHADPTMAAEMISSLPSLPVGTAWFWSPGWGDFFKQAKVRRRTTFDSSATPKAGESRREPKALAPVDVAELGSAIAGMKEKAKENDPKLLRAELLKVKGELAKAQAAKPASPAKAEIKRVEVPVLKDGQLKRAEQFLERAEKLAQSLTEAAAGLTEPITLIAQAVGKVVHPAPAPPIARTAPIISQNPRPIAQSRPVIARQAKNISAGDANADVGRGGLRRILIALAQRPGLTNRQIGVRAGLSSSSGSFSTYMSKARSNGWIEDRGDTRNITADGLSALGEYDPLPTGTALLNHWLAELGGSGAGRILRALAGVYPESMTNEQIGEAAQMSHASGSFSTYMSKLRTLELVEGSRGATRASPEFFE